MTPRTGPALAAPPRRRKPQTPKDAREEEIRGRTRAFVTVQYMVSASDEAGERQGPEFAVHAKWMGSMKTACGLNATTWYKQFDLRYDPSLNGACERCTDVLASYRKLLGESPAAR